MSNPLSGYLKIEKVYTKLPTNNKLIYNGVIKNNNIELGVCPRSAKDELHFNNPEALMNGQAVVNVINNCVPGVIDANKLYSPDVEALLIAIKLATDEESYEISTKCPECDEAGEFSRDLSYLLNTMKFLDEEPVVYIDSGLAVHMQPLTWEDQTNLSLEMFKLQNSAKLMDEDKDMTPEDVVKNGAMLFDEIAKVQFQSLLLSIQKIQLPDDNNTEVTIKEYISEWLDNQPKMVLQKLIEKTNELSDLGISHVMEVECHKCGHVWEMNNLKFDPTSFFTQGF